MNLKRNEIAIGAFLIIGTILSLIISIHCVSDFVHWKTLIYRNPPLIYILLFDFILALPIAGILSICSFFRKGILWKPVIKCIIINIYLLLAMVLFAIIKSFVLCRADLIIIAFVLGLCFLLAYLWKSVNSVNNK